MGLRFSRRVLSLDFFGISEIIPYGKRTMLKSKVVTGQQIVADVRPKESVEFSGQTIKFRGFCYCQNL